MNVKEIMKIRNEKHTFSREIGLKIIEIKEEYAKGEIIIEDRHRNIHGTVHGGCIFALGDSVAGIAAMAAGLPVVTVSGNINYLAPAQESEKLIAKAQKVKIGTKISVYDVEIKDETDKLIATGTYTFINI